MGSLLSTTLNTPMEPEEESGALIRKLYLLLNPPVGHRCCTVEGVIGEKSLASS
jgi:hypothetical protein